MNRNKLVEKYSINKNRYYNRDKIFKEKWKGVIMINLEKAEKNFKDYLKDYDLNNGNIKLKIKHTYEVMKKSEYISKGLNLNKEDIDLSKLIALLHDIGRFEQVKQTNDFIDSTGFEHANYGVKVLFEENLIRKFIDNDKYDNIIKKAIYNHNKYKIEDNLSEKEILHCKIIRDADKLDIFYEAEEIFWKNEKEEIESSKISEKVYNEFMSKRIIENSLKQNNLDKFIGIISFIYDINFKESLEIIKEQNYIKKIIERFDFKNQQTKEQIKEIEKISEEYLKNKIKG